MTPLHMAAEHARVGMIKDLVSQEADKNTTDTGVSKQDYNMNACFKFIFSIN